ncbi:MAG: MotA/TolQ/ExbB proton channel family protein [Bacteriovoracaceae bacterium]
MNQPKLNLFQAWYQFMDEGGIFMWVILAIWLVGVAIAVERLVRFHFYDVNAGKLFQEIQNNLVKNDLPGAVQACSNTQALLAFVFRAGLKKIQWSAEHIQHALDTAILEAIPKAEKRLNYLGLIANVSTLLGLLGTIQGLIESFSAVASADPSEKAKLLAFGISKAMNTTALGLVSAISIMVVHTFLTSKSEKMIGEMDEYTSKFIENFSHNKKSNTSNATSSNNNKAA